MDEMIRLKLARIELRVNDLRCKQFVFLKLLQQGKTVNDPQLVFLLGILMKL